MPDFDAYRDSDYEVWFPGHTVVLRHGEPSPELDAHLAPGQEWAFITAWNPGNERPTLATNRAQQEKLEAELATRYPLHRGRGGKGGHFEDSVLVLGISRGDALAIARRYGQAAILAGRHGSAAEVVDCRGWRRWFRRARR